MQQHRTVCDIHQWDIRQVQYNFTMYIQVLLCRKIGPELETGSQIRGCLTPDDITVHLHMHML